MEKNFIEEVCFLEELSIDLYSTQKNLARALSIDDLLDELDELDEEQEIEETADSKIIDCPLKRGHSFREIDSIDDILNHEDVEEIEEFEDRAARLKSFFAMQGKSKEIVRAESIEELLFEDDDDDDADYIPQKDNKVHLTEEEMETVAQKNIGLVYSIAGSFKSIDPCLNDELVVAGLEGLNKGLKGFDKSRTYKGQPISFTTYLVPCIRSSIINFIKKYSSDYLSQSIPIDEAFATTYDDEKSSKINNINFDEATELTFDEMIINKERCKKIRDCLEILNSDEKFVIIHSFGISEQEEYSQEQLSIILDVTQPAVSTLKKRALMKLKKTILQLKASNRW